MELKLSCEAEVNVTGEAAVHLTPSINTLMMQWRNQIVFKG